VTDADDPQQAAAFEATVNAQMQAIESELATVVEADDPILTNAARHLIAAGGKRFRPQLVVLGSKFAGGTAATGHNVTTGAMVVELTHVASLYHDDVMDDAALRRGRPSANARWGNAMAILVGDYLFSKAADLATSLGIDIIQLNAQVFNRLVRGQIAETVGPGEGVDPLDHYLQVVKDKTAGLIATSIQMGAMIAGADQHTTRLLADFGEQLGTCFQLSDDILDITSDEAGKTPGTDLREGVDTLPTLLAKRSRDPGDTRLLQLLQEHTQDHGLLRTSDEGEQLVQQPDGSRSVVSRPDTDNDEADVSETLRLLRDHPAIEQARQEVTRRAASARRVLDPLPDGPAKNALAELCATVVSRTR
jgi:heptaprenyl diphosphate synthase